MIELRKHFYSADQFLKWRKSQQDTLNIWVKNIVNDARRFGLYDPISNEKQDPGQIEIDETRLQVSLTSNGLNSRKRAGILALQMATESIVGIPAHKAKILGTEGLTKSAEIFRTYYPYYLPTEFLPTDNDRSSQFPIQHLDLMDISYPDDSFHIFHSSHVLEHVPHIETTLKQIFRILKPGGILVSTFPFRSDRLETHTKAQLTPDGDIDYLEEPEYHGNPVKPSEGSLVFQLPGWDILGSCRRAGFADAKLTLLASSRYGIVSRGDSGIFALFAVKTRHEDQEMAMDIPPQIRYAGPYF